MSYAGFLVLITIPFSLAISWPWVIESRSRRGAVALVLAITFIAGYFFLSDNGEMNLGPLDPYLDKHLINGALAMLSGVFAMRLAMGLERSALPARNSAWMIGLATAMIFFMLALSLSRPAQRYLLFIVPLFYFFLLPPQKHRRAMWACAILISVVLDIYILLNQLASGIASVEMARRIAELGLMSKTLPQAIEGNVGNRFFSYRKEEKSFAVVAGDVDGKIVGVHYSVLPHVPFIGKMYSLVPLQPPR